ncbi:MAG: PAS domain S-box protein [Thermodesulfobacteriota bacterium]|jgi:PAS domain S-box-containing protein
MNVIEIVKRKWNGTQNIPKSAIEKGFVFESAIRKPQSEIEKGAFREVAVSDITERKRVESQRQQVSLKTLGKSGSVMRAITDSAQDAILMMDPTGCISFLNPAAEQIFGYTSKEAIGQDLHQFFAPKRYWDAYHDAFSKFKKTGQGEVLNKTIELQARRRDGDEFPVELSLSAIHFEDGWHALGIIRDITERKEVNRKLQEAVMFQQQLIDALPVPVFYKDSEGRYLGCNSSFEKFFGQKREQVTGKSVYELSPKEFADIYHEKDRVLLQNPGIQIYESTVKDTDGVVHNVIFHKATFPNMDGSVGGLIGGILDITDSKRAEEALRDSEGRLHTLVQTIPDLIWQKDKDGVYRLCNTMFERFFGAREADIVGKTDYDFVDRELADSFREHDRKAMAAGKTTSNEEWITFADDGHRVFLDTIKTPVYDSQGTLIGVLGIGRDITDRMAVERIRKALGATIHAIAVTVEARDPYTAGHQRRVADLARSIATEMNLPIDRVDGIRMAAAIHDLGKISLPAEILSKPTKLTNIELMLIKTHSQSGYDILKDIDFPWPVARIILEHHERMNGSGYPNGLTGNNILLESRILAVADVLESMASHRPYRPALGVDAALEELEKNKGILYDLEVVDVCLRLFREKGYKF